MFSLHPKKSDAFFTKEIEEALLNHINGSVSYINPLINPSIKAGVIKAPIKREEINEYADKITLWNLEESKRRILKNTYIKSQIDEGKIGLCSGFFYRSTGKIKFSQLSNSL